MELWGWVQNWLMPHWMNFRTFQTVFLGLYQGYCNWFLILLIIISLLLMDFKHVSRMWVTPSGLGAWVPGEEVGLVQTGIKTHRAIPSSQHVPLSRNWENWDWLVPQQHVRFSRFMNDVGVSMFSGELQATSVFLSSDFLLPSGTVRFTEEWCFGFTNHPT